MSDYSALQLPVYSLCYLVHVGFAWVDVIDCDALQLGPA